MGLRPACLPQVRLGRGLRPQILLGLVGHDLAVHEVADTGEDDEEKQLLHGGSVPGP